MDKESLLIKWLDGELSDSELALFKQLPEYQSYKKLNENAAYFKSPIINKEKQYAILKSRLEKEKRLASNENASFKILMRIAAIFVVGLGLYVATIKEDLVKVNTSIAEQTNFSLPDNSEIILNADSKIKYNEKDWEKKREVILKGEAFFKVAKGEKFEVETDLGTVTVLGTKFNVKQRGKLLEVHCYEGLVKVEVGEYNFKLPEGTSLRLFENKLKKGKTNFTNPSWISGKTTFESVPYYVVVEEFERQYGVTVVLNNFDRQKIFTGSFIHDNMDLALKSITQPFKLSYKINKDHIRIFKND
ncbi:FecR family protein [Salinimicrobium catena]|uniref:FecR family protein n=1 Tax=Salinimicrobium catena TaxID=390640 RepID=A0A1H5NZ14_9FLAO|nr:FecR family protein [Salinimicrobium catena]SDL64217.1 FecR family protein [Salinimicrobium catena]SEF06846.1 FecR family protein [Salinimicrobium catena]